MCHAGFADDEGRMSPVRRAVFVEAGARRLGVTLLDFVALEDFFRSADDMFMR